MSSLSTSSVNEGLGARLLAVRQALGMSQAAFAASIGLSLRAYTNYERGEREAPVAVLRAVYLEHSIDLTWLVDGHGDVPVRAHTHTPDLALIDELIRAIDARLAKARRPVPKALRMKLIGAAYELCADEKEVRSDRIDTILSLVA